MLPPHAWHVRRLAEWKPGAGAAGGDGGQRLVVWSPVTRHQLLVLRARFGASRDLFSAREQARLRWVTWLVGTGRIRRG